jgi:hypothetical protein
VKPSPLDYQDALARPERSLLHPVLQGAEVLGARLFGKPVPVSGRNAQVYRLRLADGSIAALRLFVQPAADRKVRFDALNRQLARFEPMPEVIVSTWLDDAVTVRSQALPAVLCPWADGVTLNAFVDANVNRAARLRELAESVVRTILALERRSVAHGDLQCGNLLVSPEGTLALIDWDGVWTPELSACEPAESGHPAFQHPLRSAADYSLGATLDRFSALVIVTALRSVAAAPEVWYRLDNGDNLLFRPEDYLAPDTSRAFSLLREHLRNAPDERRLVAALAAACAAPARYAPPLSDVTLFG